MPTTKACFVWPTAVGASSMKPSNTRAQRRIERAALPHRSNRRSLVTICLGGSVFTDRMRRYRCYLVSCAGRFMAFLENENQSDLGLQTAITAKTCQKRACWGAHDTRRRAQQFHNKVVEPPHFVGSGSLASLPPVPAPKAIDGPAGSPHSPDPVRGNGPVAALTGMLPAAGVGSRSTSRHWRLQSRRTRSKKTGGSAGGPPDGQPARGQTAPGARSETRTGTTHGRG